MKPPSYSRINTVLLLNTTHYIWISVFYLGSSKELSDSESKLGIPQHYDKRYRINLSVVNRDVEDFLRKGRLPGMSILHKPNPGVAA